MSSSTPRSARFLDSGHSGLQNSVWEWDRYEKRDVGKGAHACRVVLASSIDHRFRGFQQGVKWHALLLNARALLQGVPGSGGVHEQRLPGLQGTYA